MQGFIKLPREIIQHDALKNHFDFRLFMLILNGAIFKEEYELGNLKLKKGEWFRSISKLQEDLTYIENNKIIVPTIKKIRCSLQRLQGQALFVSKGTSKGTLFVLDQALVSLIFGHNDNEAGTEARAHKVVELGQHKKNDVLKKNELKKNVKEQQHRSGCSFYDKYYSCYGRQLNPIQIQQFISYLNVDQVEEELLCYAFEVASKVSSHINYVKAIINNWIAKGIKTFSAAKVENERSRGDTNGKRTEKDQYSDLDLGF